MKSPFTLTLSFFILSISVISQDVGKIYGLNFANSSLRLATVNPNNGVVDIISSTELSQDQFSSGNSDLNPNDNYYHYVRFGQIITANIETGQIVFESTLFCEDQPIGPVQGISNIAYNWADSTLYGLVHYDQELTFAKVDFVTGEITIISEGPITNDQYSSGVSDIDPIEGRYFYLRANRIITIDISTGEILQNEPIFNPNGAVQAITNIAYDWLSNVIYGINFVSSTWDNNGNTITQAELKLAAINPNDGTVVILSPQPLSPDQFSSGVSDIDPVNQKYYYIRANRIYSVDIVTGELVESAPLSNPNDAVAPITNIEVYNDKDSQPNPNANFEENESINEFWFKNISNYAREVYWDFGDGETSEKRHPEHTFQEPGTYEVTLSVVSLSGEEHSYTKSITVDGILSTNSLNLDGLKVYPNPASDELFIHFENGKTIKNIRVYDSSGRLILNREKAFTRSSKIDLSNLESGLYTLALYGEGETTTRRIVVE